VTESLIAGNPHYLVHGYVHFRGGTHKPRFFARGLATIFPRVKPFAPKSPTASRPALSHGTASIDAQAREDLIREAAYFRAQRRGFEAGHDLEDWLAAERDFDQWLATRGAPPRYG